MEETQQKSNVAIGKTHNIREMVGRISKMYYISIEEIRKLPFVEILILNMQWEHRLCEDLGIAYNYKKDDEEQEENNYDETGYPKKFEAINFKNPSVNTNKKPTVEDFLNWSNYTGAKIIDNRK